jgi:hypothetical protein
MADLIVSTIQQKRGLRKDLPQPLLPGEFGFCYDTGQLFIGTEEDGARKLVLELFGDQAGSETMVNTTLLQSQVFLVELPGTTVFTEADQATVQFFKFVDPRPDGHYYRVYVAYTSAQETLPDFGSKPVVPVYNVTGEFIGGSTKPLDQSTHVLVEDRTYSLDDTSAIADLLNKVYLYSPYEDGPGVVTVVQNIEVITEASPNLTNTQRKLLQIGETNIFAVPVTEADSFFVDYSLLNRDATYSRTGSLHITNNTLEAGISDSFVEAGLDTTLYFSAIVTGDVLLLKVLDNNIDDLVMSYSIKQWKTVIAEPALAPEPVTPILSYEGDVMFDSFEPVASSPYSSASDAYTSWATEMNVSTVDKLSGISCLYYDGAGLIRLDFSPSKTGISNEVVLSTGGAFMLYHNRMHINRNESNTGTISNTGNVSLNSLVEATTRAPSIIIAPRAPEESKRTNYNTRAAQSDGVAIFYTEWVKRYASDGDPDVLYETNVAIRIAKNYLEVVADNISDTNALFQVFSFDEENRYFTTAYEGSYQLSAPMPVGQITHYKSTGSPQTQVTEPVLAPQRFRTTYGVSGACAYGYIYGSDAAYMRNASDTGSGYVTGWMGASTGNLIDIISDEVTAVSLEFEIAQNMYPAAQAESLISFQNATNMTRTVYYDFNLPAGTSAANGFEFAFDPYASVARYRTIRVTLTMESGRIRAKFWENDTFKNEVYPWDTSPMTELYAVVQMNALDTFNRDFYVYVRDQAIAFKHNYE